MASSMAVHSPAGIVFNNPVYPDESDPEEEDDEVSEDRSGSGSANYEELPAAVATDRWRPRCSSSTSGTLSTSDRRPFILNEMAELN